MFVVDSVTTMPRNVGPAFPPPVPLPACPPAVGMALAHRRRVAYVEVAAAPPDPTWRPLLDLCADMTPWLAQVAPRTGADPVATSSFLCGWVARAIAAVPAALVTADSRALIAEPADVFLRIADGGWVTGIAIEASAVVVDPSDDLAGLPGAHAVRDVGRRWRFVGETVTALTRPVIEGLRPHSRLRASALWALVVDAVNVAVTMHTDDPCRARSISDGICTALPAAALRSAAIEAVDVDGDIMLRATRVGCCFSYRTPDATRCADCPNRPPSAA